MSDICARSDEYFKYLAEKFSQNNIIPPESFRNENIKRGLRNADGSGVVAGVSLIGNVHGYVMNEGERIPTEGSLTYRGISVIDLVESFRSEDRFGFEETAYLLLMGRLPTRDELNEFNGMLGELRQLPEHFTEDMILKAPSKNVMNKLARSTLALYSYDDNPDEMTIENNLRQGIRLIASFPAIVSFAYQAIRHYFGHESLVLRYADPALSTAENILRLIRHEHYYTDAEAKLLDVCLVLHAEHSGGNNSTFACRVLSSAGSDMYSAISAAVGSLKGNKHGGASLAVKHMYDDMMGTLSDWEDDEEVSDYLRRLLRREVGDGSGLIYGMGHAIYTLSDPRAVELKKYAKELASVKGFDKEFALIERVERLAPEVFASERGVSKVMCANIDMYSGFVYNMLGIPEELFIPMFATARVAGWIAHRLEELSTGGRIIRPAYKPLHRDAPFTPIDLRK